MASDTKLDPLAPMKRNLAADARLLRSEYGPVMSRHFSVNPNAGTIKDIRNGSIFVWLDPSWPSISGDYLATYMPVSFLTGEHREVC